MVYTWYTADRTGNQSWPAVELEETAPESPEPEGDAAPEPPDPESEPDDEPESEEPDSFPAASAALAAATALA